MRQIILILFLLLTYFLQSQDSTFYYTAKNDSLIFLTVKSDNEIRFYDPYKLFAKWIIKGDTVYHYNADTLQYMTIKHELVENSYYRELDKWIPAFKIVEKKAGIVLKSDGICNGITLLGKRCKNQSK